VGRYLVRRSFSSLVTLFGVLTLVFFLVRLHPGDVSLLYDDPGMDDAAREAIRRAYGLDQPLASQYVLFLASTLRLEFGSSFSHHRPVAQVIAETIPLTALLAGAGLFVELLAGTGLALLLDRRRAAGRGTIAGTCVLALHSIPSFWLGLVLVAVFAHGLGLLPPSGAGPPGAAAVHLVDRLRHLLLPAATLGLAGAPAIARHLAASLERVSSADFVRTARAKGLSPRAVLLRHALKPALLPVVTIVGLSLPLLVSGALVVEVVFAWPGMGRLAINALHARDYPLVIACTAVAGAAVVAGGLVADLVHAAIDPRVRDAHSSDRVGRP